MRLSHNVAVISCLLIATACGSSVRPSPNGSSEPVPSTGPSASASASLDTAGPVPSTGPSASASLDTAGPVRVVMGLYSGRPDPEWTLTAEQAATLVEVLAALPAGTGTPPVGGLGYHGFTILLPGRTLVAYRGVVARVGGGPPTVRTDPTLSVERNLLETSRLHVTAQEYDEVKGALAGL